MTDDSRTATLEEIAHAHEIHDDVLLRLLELHRMEHRARRLRELFADRVRRRYGQHAAERLGLHSDGIRVDDDSRMWLLRLRLCRQRAARGRKA